MEPLRGAVGKVFPAHESGAAGDGGGEAPEGSVGECGQSDGAEGCENEGGGDEIEGPGKAEEAERINITQAGESGRHGDPLARGRIKPDGVEAVAGEGQRDADAEGVEQGIARDGIADVGKKGCYLAGGIAASLGIGEAALDLGAVDFEVEKGPSLLEELAKGIWTFAFEERIGVIAQWQADDADVDILGREFLEGALAGRIACFIGIKA